MTTDLGLLTSLNDAHHYDKGSPHTQSSPKLAPTRKEPPQTDANILPETSDESPEISSDFEKADPEAKPTFAGIDPSSFPDGGLQAWLAVSGAFCCIGIFQTYYQQNQLRDYSPSTVAWIPSLTTFFMFAGVCLSRIRTLLWQVTDSSDWGKHKRRRRRLPINQRLYIKGVAFRASISALQARAYRLVSG
ncbi:MAG: hypothetical protein Q9181_000363 [Wetmoreana brouardii]